MENDKKKICCIRGKKSTEPDNSPFPVRGGGEYCWVYDWTVVLRERFRKGKQSKK